MSVKEPTKPKVINQCDGCARGLPIIKGLHKGVGWDIIGCTKHLYKNK